MKEATDNKDGLPERVPDPFGPVIPWGGGECPVFPDVIVRLYFRARGPYVGAAMPKEFPEKHRAKIWHHAPASGRNDPKYDVIAYQVLNG